MEDAADTIVRSLACVSVFIIAQDTGPEGAPGFASIQRSSVESLLDILTRYLRTLGTLSAQGAQHAGRAEANFLDVHLALKAVGVASPRELLAFSRVRELPYPHPVHILYPVRPSEMRTFASGCPLSWAPLARPAHVPDFTPPFPDSTSCSKNTVYQQRELNVQATRRKRSRLKRDAQDQLLSLQQASSQGHELPQRDCIAHVVSYAMVHVAARLTDRLLVTGAPPTPCPPLSWFTLPPTPARHSTPTSCLHHDDAFKICCTAKLLQTNARVVAPDAAMLLPALPPPLSVASCAHTLSGRTISSEGWLADMAPYDVLSVWTPAVLQSSASQECCGLPGTASMPEPPRGHVAGMGGAEADAPPLVAAISAQPGAIEVSGGKKTKVDAFLGLQHLHDLDEMMADTKYTAEFDDHDADSTNRQWELHS